MTTGQVHVENSCLSNNIKRLLYVVSMTRDFDQAIGRNIQHSRKARGWSQADLAGRLTERGLSLPQQTINRIEHGERPLKFEEARTIADALGVTVDSFAQHFSNDPISWSAMEIHAAKLTKAYQEENIEKRRAALVRDEAQARSSIEEQEARIRQAEQRLRD